MGILDRLFGRGGLKIPVRHRSAAYMNLAFGRVPTAGGTWDTTPLGLTNLTDGSVITPITGGADNDAAEVYIEIDLGAEFEVYEINVYNNSGEGIRQAAGGASMDFTLKTLDGASTSTTRDTQAIASDNAWKDITLAYLGNGIPIRYVRLCFTADGTRIVTLLPSEIEVFGC